MLARFLLVARAAQLALYALLGAYFWPWWGAAFAPAAVLLTDAAVIARSFARSRRHAARSSEPTRLTAWRKAQLFLDELYAFTALFTFLQPLERRFVRPPTAARAADRRHPPVVLVPGIYCNAGLWWSMRRRLEARGLTDVWAVTLEPPLAGIDELAQRLAEHIERICEAAGAPRVILVGHSMGGLVARACLRDARAGARIAKIITVATPHHGSELARLAIGLDGRQLRRASAWLAALNALGPAPVPIVSLFSWHDNFVAPQDSAILSGADNVPFSGIGHLSMVFSARIAARVAVEIAQM